jgi:hypothetical protein
MRYGFYASFAAAVVLSCLALESTASASAADQISSPALFARVRTYSPPAGAHPDQKSIGPTCTNDPDSMPTGRQSLCSTNDPQRLSAGVYRIVVDNGAPLPVAANFPLDTGWSLFVTPVNSNARCAETSTTWASNNLTSTITCVSPSGSNMDTQFSWIYRTDSGNYSQGHMYPLDFAYARVNRGSGNQVVASQTFNPFGGAVTSQRLATGQFRVTFQDMNLATSAGFVEATTGMNNVVVQRTCMNDTTADCKRAVCVPTAWSFGSAFGTNTTVDVQCHLGATPINVDFRMFIGNQAVTSQADSSILGQHFGWAVSPGFGPNPICKGTNEFVHRNQHETPSEDYPTLPLGTCRTGTGAYSLDFAAHGGFYSRDQVGALATSRSVGAYCNVGSILCGGQQCSPPPAPYVTVRCYDNATGAAKNALWNLSMTY